MLPIPPMITTTSAFMVNSMPMAGIEGEEGAHQRARGSDQAAAAGESQSRQAANIDADELGSNRIDGQRPKRGAEPCAVENQPADTA